MKHLRSSRHSPGKSRLKRIAAAAAAASLLGGALFAQSIPAQALENDLALTPPMGWNSWNQVRCYGLTEELVKKTADSMVSTGMAAAGYDTVVVDDCWQGGRGNDGVLFSHPERFPSGMAAIGKYIHDKGLKFGIYGVPGSETCANYWDSYPIKGLGSIGHEQQDADTFAAWGVDYLKYDWCRADVTDNLQRQPAFEKMRDALAKTGRPIVYGISEYGEQEPWKWGSGVANLWRTTHDIAPTWASVSGIINAQAGLAQYAKPGAWNDPDMLQVGNGSMTEEENRSHFGMWAMLAAPLFTGTDLSKLTPATLATITNKEVIAVNQDKLGKQADRISNTNGLQVWAKPLSDGNIAVALYNTSATAQTIQTSVAAVGGQGSYSVRSLWDGKDTVNTSTALGASVPSHGTVILRLTPGSKVGLPTVPEVSGEATLKPGTSGTMTVTVKNPGASAMSDAQLTFTTTTGLTPPTQPVSIPKVDVGASVSLKVPVSAAANSGGKYQVQATISTAGSSYPAVLNATVLLPDTAYISDMAWISSSNGWGPVERDMAVGGNAANDGPGLKLDGVSYPKGLGTNPATSIKVALDGQCSAFSAVIGIDDDVTARAAADGVTPRSSFEVLVDGKSVLLETVALGSGNAKKISVPVSGASTIELKNAVVGTDPKATWHVWSDWADAKLDCADTEAPTATIDLDLAPNAAGWLSKAPTVTLGGTDDRPGDLSYEYQLDEGAWIPYTAPFVVDREGTTKVSVRAKDSSGNASSILSRTIKVDLTAPTVTPVFDASNRSFTVSASDGTSGVKLIELRLPEGEWIQYQGITAVDPAMTARSMARALSAEPANSVPLAPPYFEFRATDNAGDIGLARLDIPALPTGEATANPTDGATPNVTPVPSGTSAPSASAQGEATASSIASNSAAPQAEGESGLPNTGTSTGTALALGALLLAAGAGAVGMKVRRRSVH